MDDKYHAYLNRNIKISLSGFLVHRILFIVTIRVGSQFPVYLHALLHIMMSRVECSKIASNELLLIY